MSRSKKQVPIHGRMLAFLLVLMLLVSIGTPTGQVAFADGGGSNDTITSYPGIDSMNVVPTDTVTTTTAEMGFVDWVILMASLL